MRRLLTALILSLSIVNCAPKPTETVDLSKMRASFMMTDGSSISTDEYDEYNPVLIRRTDNLLALIFASDRACSGCTAGLHNLFIAISAGPYENDLEVPLFNPPVLVMPDGSGANSVSRLRFAAEGLGSMIAVAFEYSGSISQFTLTEANQATGTGTSLSPIGNTPRSTETLIGFGAESGSILTRDGSGKTRYSLITAAHNGRAVPNSAFDDAESVTYLDSSQTFFNAGVFVVDAGSLMFGTLYENFGPHESMQDALDEEDVSMTAASVYSPGPFSNDVLIFSGNDGTSDDLYAVTSHSAGALWALEDVYGDFSDRADVRNLWLPVPASLPATRTGMAAGIVGDKGYLITGFNGSTTNTIYEFDFALESFTNCGNGPGIACTPVWPASLYGASAAVAGNLIYVVGGTPTGSTTAATNTFGYFDTSNYTVTSGLPVYPLNRMSPAVTVSGNKFFAMGGSSNATNCSGTNYNCTNNYFYTLGGSWSAALTNIPYGFTNGASALYGDSIYIFGGTSDGTNGITALSEYSITGDSWPNCGSSCGNLSQARFDLQVVPLGSKAYIMGGMHGGAYTTYNIVEEFDMETGSLSDCDGGCATMPVAIANGSAMAYGNSIYYFGGRTDLTTYVNTVYKYIP